MTDPHYIRSIDRLDAFVEYIDAGAQLSYAEMHRRLAEYTIELDLSRFQNLDPFSADYQTAQMDFYEELTGGRYQVASEATQFNVDDAARNPYPYPTQSTQAVGEHLAGIGKLIESLPVQPPARVLDMGPGWGNTTLALAKMGYQVCALDFESRFVELIGRRAAAEGVQIDVRQGEFGDATRFAGKFDLILFFESFHHAPKHNALLKNLIDKVLAPDGSIMFAGEPIHAPYPAPWVLRQDPLSIYCIRKFGWFELGFSEAYFYQLLRSNGLEFRHRKFNEVPIASHVVARRRASATLYDPNTLYMGEHDGGWNDVERGGEFRFTRGKGVIPLSAPEGTVSGVIKLSNFAPKKLPVTISVGTSQVVVKLSPGETREISMAVSPADLQVVFEVEQWNPAVLGLSADDRNLGVAVHSVTLKR